MAKDRMVSIGRARARFVRLLIMATVLALSAPQIPGEAHRGTNSGTIYFSTVILGWHANPIDWWRHEATQCGDVKDAVNVALYNAVPYRGHKVRVTIIGAENGTPKLDVDLSFIPCNSTERHTTFTYGSAGEVKPGQPLIFTVDPDVHSILIYNISSAVEVAYSLSFDHLS